MPAESRDRAALRRFYEESAREYFRTMTPEQFAETVAQARQRAVTLTSFNLLSARRPDIHCFNRISVWRPGSGTGECRFVTPDHTVVIHPGPVPLDADPVFLAKSVRPTLAVNYVSPDFPRGIDAGRLDREAEVGIPHALEFDADHRTVTGYRLASDGRYEAAPVNTRGRIEVPELELEAAVQGGWVRFWFRGKRLPTITELARQVEAANRWLAAGPGA